MFKLSEFKAEIESKGVLKSNHYDVSFTIPPALRTQNYSGKTMTMRCENAQLPGVGFATIDGAPRLGYGPQEPVPYNVIFEDLSLTFVVDSGGEIHKFFNDWVNTIVNFKSLGQSALGAKSSITGNKPFEVSYRDDFVTDISVTLYKESGASTGTHSRVLRAKAYRAYPRAMPSLDVSWSTNDDLVKLVIPFSFTDYNITYF